MGLVTVNERPRVAGGRVWVSSSIYDIDRRIKEGDESGWRGDPSMGLFLNPTDGRYEVWGIDRAGNQYLAASHDRCDHTLLQKLVAGDPTRNDVVGRVLATNARLEQERQDAERDKRLEVADKLGWAIRQDFGHLAGGRRVMHGMYDGRRAS